MQYQVVFVFILFQCPTILTLNLHRLCKLAGSARGNQGAELSSGISLNTNHTPPVAGALGVIGLSGRAGNKIQYLKYWKE